MSETPIPSPVWWRALLIVLILLSATYIVFPQTRSVQPLNLGLNVLFFGCFGWTIIRDWRRGLLRKSLSQLHADAQRGVRLRHEPLETAAAIAFVLTTMMNVFSL